MQSANGRPTCTVRCKHEGVECNRPKGGTPECIITVSSNGLPPHCCICICISMGSAAGAMGGAAGAMGGAGQRRGGDGQCRGTASTSVHTQTRTCLCGALCDLRAAPGGVPPADEGPEAPDVCRSRVAGGRGGLSGFGHPTTPSRCRALCRPPAQEQTRSQPSLSDRAVRRFPTPAHVSHVRRPPPPPPSHSFLEFCAFGQWLSGEGGVKQDQGLGSLDLEVGTPPPIPLPGPEVGTPPPPIPLPGPEVGTPPPPPSPSQALK